MESNAKFLHYFITTTLLNICLRDLEWENDLDFCAPFLTTLMQHQGAGLLARHLADLEEAGLRDAVR
jgi:hypothetical protein